MRQPTTFETELWIVAGQHVMPVDVPRKNNLLGFVDGRLIFQVNDAWSPKGSAAIVAGSL